MEILNLCSRPDMTDILANRCWSAWWTETNVSLAEYRAHLEPMLQGNGVPIALVAHDQGKYLGSVLLIENDLDERPEYAPWIAALWVEPEARRRGIAAKLIEAARKEAADHGYELCYLCATPENSRSYIARGFEQIETDVSGLNVFTIKA